MGHRSPPVVANGIVVVATAATAVAVAVAVVKQATVLGPYTPLCDSPFPPLAPTTREVFRLCARKSCLVCCFCILCPCEKQKPHVSPGCLCWALRGEG